MRVKLILDFCLAAEDLGKLLGWELKSSVVGKKTVLLLLYIGKLSVAVCEDILAVEKHVGKSLKTCEEFILGGNALAVSPSGSILVYNPLDSAVLADEYRLCGIVLLSVLILAHKLAVYYALFNMCVVLCKLFGILLVVVHVVAVVFRAGVRTAVGND